MTIHGATSPYECFVFCGIYSSCQGLNWDDNDECVLLTDITSTVEVTSSHWAAIERFSTNPCVVTVTGASTQLSTETTVMEYTTTYTSTITLSTSASVASTSPTSSVATSTYISSVSTSTASACTVSALPTTTDCVDGYYVYNEEYYQVLCSDTMRSYSGFLPNSRQADIWGCIEVCSTYSNCIGTFWFLGICYSESGAIDYSYVPYDYSDPDNNVVDYIALRLDDNPCAVTTSTTVPTSSTILSSSTLASSSAILTSSNPIDKSTPVVPSASTASPSTLSSASPSPVTTKLSTSSVPLIRTSPVSSFRSSPSLDSSAVDSTVPVSVPLKSSSALIPVQPSTSPVFHSSHSSSASLPLLSNSFISQSSISNIPAASSQSTPPSARRTTTIFTTETRTSVTTICPLKATKTASTLQPADVTSPAAPKMTTSTVFTTRVYTITACPPWVSNCPASDKTTSYTTEIIPLYTTMCPVSLETSDAYAIPTQTSSNGGVSTEQPQALTTSTVFTTKVHTMAGCPQRSPHCAASEKTTYYTTETIAAYTTICPVAAEETGTHASGQATAIGEGSIGPSSERLSTSTVYTTRVYPTTVCLSSSTTCADTERTTYFTTETAVASVSVITSAAVDTAADNSGAQVTPSGGESSASTITAVLYTTEVYMNTKGTKTYFTTSTIPITTTMTPTASEIPQFSPTSEARSALLGPHSSQQGVSGASTIGSGADADGQIGVSAESQGSSGEGSSSLSSSNGDSTHLGTAGSPGPSPHVSPWTVSSVGSVVSSSLNVSSWSNGSHSLGVPSPSLGLNRPTLGSIAGSHTASVYASGTSTVVSAQYTGSAARSAVWTWLPFVGVVIGYFL